MKGDHPFQLQVYLNGSRQPICLGDTSMVAATCEAAGFPYGGYFVENMSDVYNVDALPVSPPFTLYTF